jgi:NitT/TauT family transport system ATP-binding protein
MTARPGRRASEVAIDAPTPRDEAFRTSPLYNDYCRTVSAQLAAAIQRVIGG